MEKSFKPKLSVFKAAIWMRCALENGADFLKSCGQQVSDIVFPPVCVGCGQLSGAHDALCGVCWAKVHFIDQPHCAITGHPFSYDLGPGIVSAQAIANPPPFKRARAAIVYDGLAREMVHRLKYNDRGELAPLMARWMVRAGADCLNDADCIVPIPLHRWRLLSRKYNQSAELARAIVSQWNGAEERALHYLPGTLFRTKSTKPQVGLPAKARERNVAGAFHIPHEKRDQILGRRILLIDDVFTTGATVNAATKVLLRAGAEDVSVLTFAVVVGDL